MELPNRWASPSCDGIDRTDEFAGRIRDLTLVVADLTDEDPAQFGDATRPRQVISELWSHLLLELAGGGASARVESIASALAQVREIEQELDGREQAQGVELLRQVRAALGSLRSARTVDDLFGRAAVAACSLGFDRALLSIVDHGRWRLHAMHVERDMRWAEEILAVGQEESPVLDAGIVEHDVVVGADALLVHDVQDNRRVNRPLAEITRSDSYGVAPLVVNGRIIGLVHGDCYHQGRRLGDRDQALLGLFAEGVSHAFGRVSVVERLDSIREGLEDLTLPSLSSPPRPVVESTEATRPAGEHVSLTRRENEIISLLADGDANRMIARRLSITEGTVKCHVTNILRKLGAANRAEAVSIWLRAR